jgi:hypothetical protein
LLSLPIVPSFTNKIDIFLKKIDWNRQKVLQIDKKSLLEASPTNKSSISYPFSSNQLLLTFNLPTSFK